MLARYTRPVDTARRIDQEREAWAPPGLTPVCESGGSPSRFRVLLVLFLFSVLFGPVCAAADGPDTTGHIRHSPLVSSARAAGVHPALSGNQSAQFPSLIAQVSFNQTALSFENGVTAGPAGGDLAIQFAAPVSGVPDRLRYRLLGFDTEWRETGKEREVLYSHLAPGRYEFDFEPAESNTAKGYVMESLPIIVIGPYWQTPEFRSLSIIFLALLVFFLHRLRVRRLLRGNQKLQETVSLTKVELTLAAKIAGDAQEALKEQALKDSLTGLWNRRAIFAMLEREIHRAQRDRFPITLVMIDVDHFKKINDAYGHLIGDEALREAAGRLFEVMRPYDFAGRYGGEEFLVVLPSCPSHHGVQRADDFRRAIAERPVPTANGPLAMTCSLGVAAYDYGMLPEDLIQRADEALYRAKRMGRNCVCAGNQAEVAAGSQVKYDPTRVGG
jgi:diguanylate cyclase (GGDEF)-like protein